jgi:hypothetical protein
LLPLFHSYEDPFNVLCLYESGDVATNHGVSIYFDVHIAVEKDFSAKRIEWR